MIKATELRIGNWFWSGYNCKYSKVLAIIPKEVGLYAFGGPKRDTVKISTADVFIDLDSLDPITLTPEILENSGFLNGRKRFIELQCTNIDPELDYWVVAEYDQINGQGHLLQGLKIKYVHQLQNFYYWRKGEELEIKLPMHAKA